MTRDDFRRIALALPHTVETAGDGAVEFTVAGKVFARLRASEPRWGDVMLSAKDSQLAAQGEPEIFAPLPGGWFRQGFTQINLAKAGEHTLSSALAAAWRLASPRRLRTAATG